MRLLAAVAAALALAALLVWAVLRDPYTPRAESRRARTPDRRVLRVCADPNNLPFSNRAREGFENRIAELVARNLHADLEYYWWPQRRAFIRNTLKAHHCDLVVGIPSASDMVLTTEPYYRSTYVFVSRQDRNLNVASFDAPELRRLRIGVQVVGEDYNNTPPVHALSRRHIIRNVSGYLVVGDYAQPNPPERLLEAVDRGDVDIAVAWGPLAGWYAKTHGNRFAVVPVSPAIELPYLPFRFDIAMGVRRGEDAFKRELDGVIESNEPAIARILDEYGIPNLLR